MKPFRWYLAALAPLIISLHNEDLEVFTLAERQVQRLALRLHGCIGMLSRGSRRWLGPAIVNAVLRTNSHIIEINLP